MQKKPYNREISCNEQLYEIVQEKYSTFNIQFMLQIQGHLDLEKLKQAILHACNALPISRSLKYENRWVDGQKPIPITQLDYFPFDNRTFSNDFFQEKFDLNHEMPLHLYVVQAPRKYLIFKAYHGFMDGKGLLTFVETVFQALRNEPLQEHHCILTDATFTNSKTNCRKSIFPKTHCTLAINNNQQRHQDRTIYHRIVLKQRQSYRVGKIAAVLRQYFKEDAVTFMIPVDLRRHEKDLVCTSNLTLPIFLKTRKQEKDSAISKRLLKQLAQKKELNLGATGHPLLPFIPKKIVQWGIGLVHLRGLYLKQFSIGGIISDIGTIPLKKLETPDFKVTHLCSLPVQQPFSPFAVTTATFGNRTEMVISSSTDVVTKKQLKEIALAIEAYFSPKGILHNALGNFDFIQLLLKNLKFLKDDPACIEGTQTITYGQLDALSNHLGEQLSAQGILPETKLYIHTDRSANHIVGIITALKLGIPYVPIDKDIHPKVKAQMLTDPTGIILTDEPIAHAKCIFLGKEILLEGLAHAKEIPQVPMQKNPIIYRIFTSGSTGNPKAVDIRQHNLSNYLSFALQTYGAHEKRCCPLFTNLSCDLTVTSIFLPLLSGGTIYMYRENLSNGLLSELLQHHDIDSIKCTPSHLKLMLGTQIKPNNKKLLIIGGESFATSTAQAAKNIFGDGCRIYNEYGPTEATVGCVVHEYDPTIDLHPSVYIGNTIPNVQSKLWDESTGTFCESKGELLIEGLSVVQSLEATQQQNPYLVLDGQKYYRTGDLVENHCGKLLYLGRKDRQVKINGYRIELAEIENVICEFPNVLSAIVSTKGNSLLCEILPSKLFSETLLMTFLKERLPKHMVPKELRLVTAFSLSPSGKMAQQTQTQQICPETKKMLCCWEKAFEKIFSQEEYRLTFYALGGDSLTLLSLINEIEQTFKTKNFEKKLMRHSIDHIEQMTMMDFLHLVQTL